MLTLGGYHPDFHRDGYPVLPRLGLSINLFGFLSITGQTYFALTSEAVMAGVLPSPPAPTGFSATMDDWAPSFVDALAAHHRVVVYDNAGVGETAALPGPLTISAMAGQTSALISALRPGRPAVLGWSMGGMIAQALAVRHPGQVSRLVFAATQAGTGMSLPIPPAAQAAAASSNPAVVLSVLFPADQAAAARTYVAEILQYPNPYTMPVAVKNTQTFAIQQWMAGQDPAGPRLREVRAPTLVSDGTKDVLDPVANDWLLARTLRDARLALLPGRGPRVLVPGCGGVRASCRRIPRPGPLTKGSAAKAKRARAGSTA